MNRTNDINILNRKMNEHGFDSHAIHTGPILRNENYYKRFSFEERKALFNDLMFFAKKVSINYHTICQNKKNISGSKELVDKLSKQLSIYLKENLLYFIGFDKIIVYYDYGQSEITAILTSVFNALFNNVEFRHVQPYDYKLFQVADLICTLELSKLNYENSTFSKSEELFYGNYRTFKSFYYKSIKKKQI